MSRRFGMAATALLVALSSLNCVTAPRSGDAGRRETVVRQVDVFFAHNFLDLGPREVLEWGDVAVAADGLRSIRHKYRAETQGKEMVFHQVFTFDGRGNFVRVKDLPGFPRAG